MVWRPENPSMSMHVASSVTKSDGVDADDADDADDVRGLNVCNDHIFGLVNVGAICWFNSLIQAIMSVPRVVSLIDKKLGTVEQTNDVYNAFGRFIEETQRVSHKIHNASSILVALIPLVKNFGHAQEDAQEGFHLLLDAMPKEVSQLFESSWCVDLYCDSCRAIVSTHTKEETMSLVIMERDFIPLSLSGDPFVQFMSGHMMPVLGYKCPKCSKCSRDVTSMSKTMRIVRLVKPANVLVVSFNKYMSKWQGPGYSSSIDVEYKNGGRLREVEGCVPGGIANYELVAVIRHMGNMHGGHYNALCRRGTSIVALDDANVAEAVWKPCPEDYMLFYARK